MTSRVTQLTSWCMLASVLLSASYPSVSISRSALSLNWPMRPLRYLTETRSQDVVGLKCTHEDLHFCSFFLCQLEVKLTSCWKQGPWYDVACTTVHDSGPWLGRFLGTWMGERERKQKMTKNSIFCPQVSQMCRCVFKCGWDRFFLFITEDGVIKYNIYYRKICLKEIKTTMITPTTTVFIMYN